MPDHMQTREERERQVARQKLHEIALKLTEDDPQSPAAAIYAVGFVLTEHLEALTQATDRRLAEVARRVVDVAKEMPIV